MASGLMNVWADEDGVLSFEWVLLVTLLTIGIVSGIAAARDGIIDELGDVAQAMLAVDGSYTIDFPLGFVLNNESTGASSNSGFTDAIDFRDCNRATSAPSQTNP